MYLIRGLAHHSDVLNMLLNLEPPLGFGNKCPKFLAYKRFMKLNMPIDDQSRVHFTTTLFSLIRESLKIKILNLEEATDGQADQADEELRAILIKLWSYIDVKKIDLCVPYKYELHGTETKRVMTVGKIYAALLMVGNYRNYKESMNAEKPAIDKIMDAVCQESIIESDEKYYKISFIE